MFRPGDSKPGLFRFRGSVTGKREGSNGENFVEVTFQAANSLGNHVSGTAVVSLLDGSGA